MAFQLTSGKRVIIGEHALEMALPHIMCLGSKALIVTGKIVTKNGIANKLINTLLSVGIDSAIFNEIIGEPDDKMVAAGVAAYKKEGCDFIIGLGGGSPLDTAKAIAAMTVLPGEVQEYAGKELSGDFPPLVLVPTTAGTGSEATKFFCVTDSSQNKKLLMKGEDLLPDIAVVDYTYTLSSPQSVTAATGMDALTHAVEAYTSQKANPVTDVYALDAIARIFSNLTKAYLDGTNRQAREEMAFAAYEAGFCINNSSVTIVHGMSRPIGALFHVPHGISNAMLISECLRFALDGAYGRFGTIGRVIGAAHENANDIVASDCFIDALVSLTKKLRVPTLREYGLDCAAFREAEIKMAEDALASGSPANTMKQISRDDEVLIYERLWK